MKQAQEATYLGATITKDVNIRTEINKRISSCLPVIKSLELLWKHAECSTKWKLQVYNAVVVSRVAYGLETVELTEPLVKKLNGFYLRGLRKY